MASSVSWPLAYGTRHVTLDKCFALEEKQLWKDLLEHGKARICSLVVSRGARGLGACVSFHPAAFCSMNRFPHASPPCSLTAEEIAGGKALQWTGLFCGVWWVGSLQLSKQIELWGKKAINLCTLHTDFPPLVSFFISQWLAHGRPVTAVTFFLICDHVFSKLLFPLGWQLLLGKVWIFRSSHCGWWN